MEEIREAALAYYEAGTQEQRQLAWAFFQALDVDGDGTVSVQEFVNFLRGSGYRLLDNPSFFQALDRDGNGCLDFYEVLTLYYIIKSGRPFCDGCGVFLKGLFFTCLNCYESSHTTFDLCSACYRGKRFSHQHAAILDNYTLLTHKRMMTIGRTRTTKYESVVPKFDGHYDHWAMLMENFLRSKEYWGLVENGIPAAAEAKNIWDSLKQKYQGTTRVKRAHLQALRKEFEILHMKAGESVNEYFARTLTIANKMKANGDDKGDVAVVEKILRSMTPKFGYVVCSIKKSKDIDTLTIDELQSSLFVHKQRMSSHEEEKDALKITHGEQSEGRGRGRGSFRGRGRG
uniref:EF-hand domain-containing protein n=1 Tax=Vitis vinifera TaxID=29760 RepID=A5C569_VITVI|nr:hypothetical protein VITISV_006917 [Vitis vinifera]